MEVYEVLRKNGVPIATKVNLHPNMVKNVLKYNPYTEKKGAGFLTVEDFSKYKIEVDEGTNQGGDNANLPADDASSVGGDSNEAGLGTSEPTTPVGKQGKK